jgi:hypothetical protein
MKTSQLAKVATLLLALTVAATGVFGSPSERTSDQYAYVFVTGSMIPKKVKIHPIGTTTASNIRVYDRDEIDKTGRFNTEDFLRLDPSLQVHSFHGGPGH